MIEFRAELITSMIKWTLITAAILIMSSDHLQVLRYYWS